ncbi:MAG: HAD family hydrolase [Clostridiaceae bacterium]|nr:HAD family hydrolase [Clostridiaceae bacterium]
MIDTILFDLDGTVLPLDADLFINIYFHEMGNAFSDIISPEILYKYVWKSTEAMVQNTGCRTNEEVFMEQFASLVNEDIEIYKNRFDRFYDEGYMETKKSVICESLIKESIMLLKEKGYQLVLATNPLFPKKAIHRRIEWAGLDPSVFSYITSYEHCHYCKPHIKYYEEILSVINKKSHQCLMVGNDVQEDLIASSIGIQTFLILDYMINRTEEEINCTFQGTYKDFHRYVENLPQLNE